MPGTLIPPWFKETPPSDSEVNITSLVWGVSLALQCFAFIRIIEQTYRQWMRMHRVTAYMVFLWLELASSISLGAVIVFYVWGMIESSFQVFLGIVLCWVFQIHCIMQIIINRIALLVNSPAHIRRLKWSVFAFVTLINLSAFPIWIPAHLQINQTWIRANAVWDRTEKALYAVVDAALNMYFVVLVRSSLVACGLKQYTVLYRVNAMMIIVSVSMDIIIIASMSFTTDLVYAVFHALAYGVKLNIELSMADLIAKICKAARHDICSCACVRSMAPIRRSLFVTGSAADPENRQELGLPMELRNLLQVEHLNPLNWLGYRRRRRQQQQQQQDEEDQQDASAHQAQTVTPPATAAARPRRIRDTCMHHLPMPWTKEPVLPPTAEEVELPDLARV